MQRTHRTLLSYPCLNSNMNAERRTEHISRAASHPMPNRQQKLRMVPLLAATYFMVSGGPYGLEDLIGDGGYGWALVMLFVLPVFLEPPDRAHARRTRRRRSRGRRLLRLGASRPGPLLGFPGSVALARGLHLRHGDLPDTVRLSISHESAPASTNGHRGILLELVVVIAPSYGTCAGPARRGRRIVSSGSSASRPFSCWSARRSARFHTRPATRFVAARATRPISPTACSSRCGTTWAGTTQPPSQTRSKIPSETIRESCLTAAVMVMLTYIIPIAAVAWAGIPSNQFSTGAWVDAAHIIGGSALAITVVLAGSLDDFGTFGNLTLSYTRLPHALAQDGFLPKIFTRRLRNGAPWVSILVCGFCWALALGLSFERLITIDLLLYGLSVILEFIALVVLRRKEPNLHRPFRIPGPDWVPILLGLSPTLLIFFALYLARQERAAHMPALVFALLIAFAGLPLFAAARINIRTRRPKTQ